jgi:hypothetical protein
MEETYQDLMRALDVLYICALMIENGLWQSEDLDFTLHYDDFYEAVVNALHCCCEHVHSDYDDDNQVEHFYFSDPVMLEYYRLCREYGSRRGMKLKDNPYIVRAARYVRSLLGGGWTSCYVLHTKINHKCASGIHFMCDCYFDSHIDLLEAIITVINYYRDSVAELQEELSKPTSLAVWKETA